MFAYVVCGYRQLWVQVQVGFGTNNICIIHFILLNRCKHVKGWVLCLPMVVVVGQTPVGSSVLLLMHSALLGSKSQRIVMGTPALGCGIDGEVLGDPWLRNIWIWGDGWPPWECHWDTGPRLISVTVSSMEQPGKWFSRILLSPSMFTFK